jgi:N-acyl-D-amino-acid deacylase
LTPGSPASLTIFDPQTVASRATYESPQNDPIGVHYVIRNGKIVHQGSSH